MKHIFKILVFVLLICFIILFSCKKDPVTPVEINNLLVANAGPDQIIQFPLDSVLLDGSASQDPDDKISKWSWSKISGPVFGDIIKPTDSTTRVRSLVTGTYQFELKVTDHRGLSSKDTVQINVTDPAHPNRPPIANAGSDQTNILPVDIVNLDGRGTRDTDNNIISYLWTKISGPNSFSIINTNAIQTQVTNLVQGVYQFELKVTDAAGLFSNDTMHVTVTVTSIENINYCGSDRPQVNARLIPFGTLSEPRWWVSVASAGNKIVFAGGHKIDSYTGSSSRVDIYDKVSQKWSTAELSIPRYFMASIAVGDKIFFAGGGYFDDGDNWNYYSSIDIYDVSTDTWSVDSLSEPGFYSASSVGNKVFFAGRGNDVNVTDRVDIYDLTTNNWSTAVLSEARGGISAVTANNKIFFAGGYNGSNISSRIDIYDNATGTWSTSALYEARTEMQSIAVADKIYWAAGNNGSSSCSVEIKDVNTQISSYAFLFKPEFSTILAGINPVVKNDKIGFLSPWLSSGDEGYLDIYDIAANTWSIGILPRALPASSVISIDNTIYITGGWTSNIQNQVYKLEF